MSEPSIKLRTAKDTLVSSLFELSKSANQTASSIIDFYNAVGEDEDEKLEAFTTLTEALQKLTSATNQVQVVSSELTNPLEDDKEVIAGIASPVKAPARKRAERDPNAPKKPLTVFFAYSAYVRQALREDRQKSGLPPLSSTEITQEISKKWKEMSDVEKDKWKQAYNVELQNYHLEKLKYLEDKKNGVAPSQDAPSSAPVPIPDYLQAELNEFEPPKEKRPHEEEGNSGSSEKKKKKKKKDKKKDKHSSS
ncbi:LAQU0S04e08284g1_1 [Lachancea quebecensis]|uniref:LAQU0S04e08284g1_1 n=1 Tax=Lachancea quebecensis TaxID=1654605 RepID=A0A0P1KR04_9SACH|nr:LAQU0S04e08284g1_1 [Lachancea quebecensis]